MPTPRSSSKKTLPQFVAQVEAAHPGCPVELWAFDEHRLGLLPLARRVWAKRGSRPVRVMEPRYQWLYLYGFVRPQTGQTHLLTLPRMNAAHYSQSLQDFAQAAGAGPDKRVVLMVDGAGPHHSRGYLINA